VALPWVGVEKNYAFDIEDGRVENPPDELPGLSAFILDDGVVYRTYSGYARGLDIIDKGRDEADGDDWVRRRDEYPAR